MAIQVVLGAQLQCSFGTAPSSLAVTSQTTILSSGKPCATIQDFNPVANIPPFGNCTSPSNPAVIAAQGAPQPCVPVTTPWAPGCPTVSLSKLPALNST